MDSPSRRPVEILLIKDHPGNSHLTQRILQESPFPVHLHMVEDMEAALAFLRCQGVYAQASQPDFILLNLSKQGRREVLAAAKDDPTLAFLPVLVSLTSEAHWVFLKVRGVLTNNGDFLKPPDLRQFLRIVLKNNNNHDGKNLGRKTLE
ncbi:MAG: response regulator [Candidatus Binatia bacterium]